MIRCHRDVHVDGVRAPHEVWKKNVTAVCYFVLPLDVEKAYFAAPTVRVRTVVQSRLKLAELRQECEARGLDTKGNKGDLIARLQSYLDEHEEDVDVDDVLAEDTEDFSKVETANNVKEEKISESTEEEPPADKKVVKIVPPSSSTERLQKRAERFNMPATAESKKAIRAARFGESTENTSPAPGIVANSKAPVNVDQLKKRAERFGMNVSSVSQKIEEDEKLKKRKERFGVSAGVGDGAGSADVEAKKMKRAERFGKV